MGLMIRLMLVVCALTSRGAHAYGSHAELTVPDPLQPWQAWVLYDDAAYACPFSPQDYNARTCAWPTSLNLDIADTGASFTQRWQVYRAGYLTLPGGAKLWPHAVKVNGENAGVIQQGQNPAVFVLPGATEITGVFKWSELPDALPLPPQTALLNIVKNGARLSFPNLDAEGRLWFKQPQTQELQAPTQEEQVTLRVYRHLSDGIPFTVETWIETEVSGKPRESVLGPALLAGYTLREFEADLPAKLEDNGQLRVQLRAGTWRFRVVGQQSAPVESLARLPAAAPWPDEEIWVFEPRQELRTVRVEGVDALDPQQTTLPDAWRQWQAYRVSGEQALTLAVLRRGDPEPAPNQLQLNKTLWLDFNGKGWTVQDNISGQVQRRWRIQTDGGMALGEARVNGSPQVITHLKEVDNDGLEVRQAHLDLQAVSRIESEGAPRHWSLSASGWQEDFQSMSASLHLPPGWRLLAVNGADNAYPTWLGDWSVWDVFLLLIAVAAVGKVIGWGGGVLALITFGLVYPESPTLLFLSLNLVAVVALSRMLKAGVMKQWVDAYARLGALVLVVIALPFVVQQVRLAIYPQLENPYTRISEHYGNQYGMVTSGSGASADAEMADYAAVMSVQSAPMAPAAKMQEIAESVRTKMPMKPRENVLNQIDPQQAAQTGPGLPRWHWQEASLQWSGPVIEGQTLNLWLAGPLENRVLAILRVLLLALLVAALLGVKRQSGRWQWNAGFLKGSSVLTLMMGVILLASSPSGQAAESDGNYPDSDMLETLRERLLQARDCTPDCLGIEQVSVQVEGTRLTLNLAVGALEEVEMLLPDSQGQWQPQNVVMNGASALAMRREGERYLVVIPKGAQRLTISGPLRKRDSFQLSFALPAHNVEVQAPGWSVQGLDKGQLQGGALLFAPDVIDKRQEETPTLTQEAPPPFVMVERSLRLGLTWQIDTRVLRIAPLQGAIQLQVPLVPGESVTSREIEVKDGKVNVAMKATQTAFEWSSTLDYKDRINFQAANDAQWVEVWSVEISPLWHVSFEGIPPVKAQDIQQWQPQWQPYPGEVLSLHIEKPAAKRGATSTIDQVTLVSKPGSRESSHTLNVHVRTSKGGEQRLQLPEGIRLTQVSLDGQAQASEETNRNVVLQVVPGDHDIALTWRNGDAAALHWKTPDINLFDVARNVDITVEVPAGRWVLFVGGPSIGPAVLFWGMALVLTAVAIMLGKLPVSPLKSWQWVALLLGFSTGSWWGLAVVALWFFALAWREKHGAALSENAFNFLQMGLIALTLLSLAAFVVAIPSGLLGTPDMGIAGNASSGWVLNWYQDVMQAQLPQAWVISVPLWVYRGLMLAWSFWVAVAMLNWLPWAWRAYSTGGYWRITPRKKKTGPPLPEVIAPANDGKPAQ